MSGPLYVRERERKNVGLLFVCRYIFVEENVQIGVAWNLHYYTDMIVLLLEMKIIYSTFRTWGLYCADAKCACTIT